MIPMTGLNFDTVTGSVIDSVFEETDKNFFLTSVERKHGITGQAALANHSQTVFDESAKNHDEFFFVCKPVTFYGIHIHTRGAAREQTFHSLFLFL